MAKPIWELEPDGIYAELKRAQQSHRARTQSQAEATSAPVAASPRTPESFALGTNRVRTPGRVSPPIAASGAALELEADFDEFGSDLDFASAEFEGVKPTAETPAQLLQQLKQQTTDVVGKGGARARQPAETPAFPVRAAAPPRPDAHNKSTAPMIAKSPRPASPPPVVAKNSLPAPAPRSPSQTAPKADPDPRLTPKPAAPPSTSYSVVRKPSLLFPPKKDE